MKTVEVEGKTPRDAIDIALKKLGVPRNRVKVEILEEEGKGLFGMEGAKRAKVRITLRNEEENI